LAPAVILDSVFLERQTANQPALGFIEMKGTILLLVALVTMAEGDYKIGLDLLSRCHPESKFLDVTIWTPKTFDDVEMEDRKRIIGDHHIRRFFSTDNE